MNTAEPPDATTKPQDNSHSLFSSGTGATYSSPSIQLGRDMRKAPETVRAATLVGGLSALQLIRDIAVRCGDSIDITAELRRGWQYFDTDGYAQSVLAPAKVKSFDVDDPAYLHALSNVPSVENLNILIREGGIENLDVLAGFPELTYLRLKDAPMRYGNLAGLLDCQKLSDLKLAGGGSRLPPLPFLRHLTRLTIMDNDNLTSLAGLEQHNVVKLVLSRLPSLADIRQVEKLDNLTQVTIRGIDRISLLGITAKAGFSLRLEHCGDVDVAPLAHASELTIYYDRDTVLRHAEALDHSSSVHRI
jgi:hypothetical protein